MRLEDVYWSTEGRSSFDAVVCSCAFAALVVIGTRPFGLDEPTSIVGTAVAVAVVLGLAGACFAKGRVLLGVVGLFIPITALAGAVRLGRPDSAWAKWRYDHADIARAKARFADDRPLARANRRLGDLRRRRARKGRSLMLLQESIVDSERDHRLDKLDALRERGIEPYPVALRPRPHRGRDPRALSPISGPTRHRRGACASPAG